MACDSQHVRCFPAALAAVYFCADQETRGLVASYDVKNGGRRLHYISLDSYFNRVNRSQPMAERHEFRIPKFVYLIPVETGMFH